MIYRILHYWWRGTEGGSPGEHRVEGVRETGEKKTRKGGKRDLNEGWNGREKQKGGGMNREVNLPSPYILSQFLSPLYCFQPISPSSLNVYLTFSPSSLLFPLISPSSQLFLGHFSILPILFLPPQKGKRSLFFPTYDPHKNMKLLTYFDFHSTPSRLQTKFYLRENENSSSE